MKKKIVLGVFIVASVFCLLYFVPLPKWINKTYEGHYYTSDGFTKQHADTVHIKGMYYRYLMKNNTFRGDIQIGHLQWNNMRGEAYDWNSSTELFFLYQYKPFVSFENRILMWQKDSFAKIRLNNSDHYGGNINFFAPDGAAKEIQR